MAEPVHDPSLAAAGEDFPDADDPLNVTSHWALLIAGSSGWGNYRHQADICHAYQARN